MQVTLPDGSQRELSDGATGADLAADIGPGLARAALAVSVDGEVRDLARPLPDGATVAIVTDRSDESLDLIRHDTAHVLAAAVMDLYPGVRISIGPPIENGFYYDFEFPDGVTISEADFPAIEAKMAEHIAADEVFTREDVSAEQALERFRAEGQPYKVELIEDLGVPDVSLYTNGPFTDLCRGPHAPSTKRIKAFKLLSTAGAYWRGDSGNTMLTRIYGTAFHSKQDLADHLERLDQARARDHRKLGPQLGLFTFSELSPGMAYWLPKGTQVFNTLLQRSREMTLARGYDEVKTPLLYDAALWETSGHWGKYRENIFATECEERTMGLKPMNCPGHCHLFGLQRFSYRDLPVRYAEPGLLHRREPSGTLHGLLRVRHFIQDDAHIFCTPEQIEAEVLGCLEFGFEWYRLFGFDVQVELSTRPENRLGSDAFWDETEGLLASALDKAGLEYRVAAGEGAFYAPKIDLHATDSLGRGWQLGTVQLDYNLPERFGLTYTGADNAEHQPVLIHRALLGSLERFIGILIEETAGELPVWLAPIQASVLPVADRHNAYAEEVVGALRGAGLRADVDDRSESIGRKIRETELMKVPFMLIVGDREAESRGVSLRRHGEGDLGARSLEQAIAHISDAA
ncbi:MAG: threonyl-tRNA synthetase [Solirubrobacteraceae bacterium]|nr:threonyl-tRNA synthetase [Solirubrobacteraceae bacterium]